MGGEIRRRAARSGGVEYSDPVELHDTTRSRIEFVPFFIDRTAGGELAFKLIRYDKSAGWEQTAISLQAPAAQKLREVLGQHLAVADEDSGAYLVIRTDGTVADHGELGAEQIAAAVQQLLQTDGVAAQVAGLDLGAELLHALRTELRLRELRDAVAELTNHLREGTAGEQVYQTWCEHHSWAFGNAYVVNDQLRAISATDRIDLLLPRLLGGFRDLIELKRPDFPVLNFDSSHQNHYWSAEASKAIGQCHRYLDVLHSEVGDGGLRDAPDVVAYHPRATIVIGRSDTWSPDDHRALHGLNRRLSDMSIITFDHLLAQARRTLELVEAPDDSDEQQPTVVVPADDWDFSEDPF